MKVYVVERPYALRFASGNAYRLTSEEAQRLIDNYPVTQATRNRVILRGDDGTVSHLTAATTGGGPAFSIVR